MTHYVINTVYNPCAIRGDMYMTTLLPRPGPPAAYFSQPGVADGSIFGKALDVRVAYLIHQGRGRIRVLPGWVPDNLPSSVREFSDMPI